MTESETFEQRADEARRDADSATLTNVRDRALRAEAVWREMAVRSQRMVDQRKRNDADKALRSPAIGGKDLAPD